MAALPSPVSSQTEETRARVAAAVWNWRATPNLAVKPTALRVAAPAALVGFAAVVVIYFWWQRPAVAAFAAGIAIAQLLLAVVSPNRAFVWWHGVLRVAAGKMGIALNWLILGPIYFLIFLPFGKLRREDPLNRTWDRRATSYWQPRPADGGDPKQHERPF